jgi:hypothetical protein
VPIVCWGERTLPLTAEQNHLRGDLVREPEQKPMLRLRRAAVDSRHEAAVRSNFRLPIASTALGSPLVLRGRS